VAEIAPKRRIAVTVAAVKILLGLAAIVFLAVVIVQANQSKSTASPDQAAAVAPAQVVANRCIKVPLNTETMIDESLRKGYLAGSYRAVRSRDYKAVWFVSARVLSTSPSDNSSTYATWATLDLAGGGNLMGGDQVSLVFTPDLMRLPGANMSDDGLMESQDCSRKAAAAGGG